MSYGLPPSSSHRIRRISCSGAPIFHSYHFRSAGKSYLRHSQIIDIEWLGLHPHYSSTRTLRFLQKFFSHKQPRQLTLASLFIESVCRPFCRAKSTQGTTTDSQPDRPARYQIDKVLQPIAQFGFGSHFFPYEGQKTSAIDLGCGHSTSRRFTLTQYPKQVHDGC